MANTAIDYGATTTTTIHRKLFPGLPQLHHETVSLLPENDEKTNSIPHASHVVTVPVGYATATTGRPSQSLERAILTALRLEWPSLLLVVAANDDDPSMASTTAEKIVPESSRFDNMLPDLAAYLARVGGVEVVVMVPEHVAQCLGLRNTAPPPQPRSSSSLNGGVAVGLMSWPPRRDTAAVDHHDHAASGDASQASTTLAPAVAHWVLFEHKNDANLFEHGLVQRVAPTLLLAYGHVTKLAVARICALLREDEDTTHVVLFRGTSPVVDALCRELHANPASANDDNDTRPGFDVERILMVEKDISTDQFHAQVHETLDDAFSPLDAQIDALNQANACLQTLSQHCFWQQCRTIFLHVQIMACTLLAVGASVWYAHAYEIPPTLTNTTQCGWFAATIVVPVLVTA
jgi:hypothetical protein